jgi:hypothetical protein
LRAEKRADLIKDATETCSCGKGFEPTGGAITLFNAPMILLQVVFQITVRPVRDPISEDIPNGARVGIMTIRGIAGKFTVGGSTAKTQSMVTPIFVSKNNVFEAYRYT